MNKDFEKINCVVCGNSDHKTLYKKESGDTPIYVVICPRCGLIFLNPRWTKEKYNDFYNSDYDKEHRGYLTGESEKDLSGRAVVIDRRIDFREDYKEVLDIGTGDGSMLDFFRNKYENISVSAIEPSVASQKILKEKGINLLASDIDSDWHLLNEKRFDLIIIRQTLEHLLNPKEALKKIKHALSENGALYISVPNMMLPKSRDKLKNAWFIIPHTYYFSKNTLLSLISQSGLKPVKIIDIDCELWGIFKRGEFDFFYGNNYLKQRMALVKHHLKYCVKLVLKIFK